MRILTPYSSFFLAAATVLLAFSYGSPAWAQRAESLQLSEQKIEAGLIYNVLKYTEWPEDKNRKTAAATIVCILGAEDPFSGYLEPIEKRTVNQHAIELRHVSSTADTGSCNLLFVNAAEEQRWAELQKFLTHKPVLTVGDFSGFSDQGGMIEFGVKENHIYIELNIGAISEAHLVIYNNLRRLSTTTHPPAKKS